MLNARCKMHSRKRRAAHQVKPVSAIESVELLRPPQTKYHNRAQFDSVCFYSQNMTSFLFMFKLVFKLGSVRCKKQCSVARTLTLRVLKLIERFQQDSLKVFTLVVRDQFRKKVSFFQKLINHYLSETKEKTAKLD